MECKFEKSEKLCGQIRIAALYKEGRRFVAYPLRVTYRIVPLEENAEIPAPEVLIWAPKALFKHAVDRNRMRRVIREAYRLEKEPLLRFCENNHCRMELALNYMDKQLLPLEVVQKAVKKAIKKIGPPSVPQGGRV